MMSDWKIGYKFLKVNIRGLSSFFINGRTVRYRLNEEIKPFDGDGPLGLFVDEESAKEFFRSYRKSCYRHDKETLSGRCKLYKCKYRESNENNFWFVSNISKKRNYNKLTIPSGTTFASSIILLEEVENMFDKFVVPA
jgi:hypothetical protein